MRVVYFVSIALVALSLNAATPASITPNAGTTPQTAPINGAFATTLAATVKDASSNPVSGVSVTFTVNPAPDGASGSFGGPTTVTTDGSGVATAPTLTANGVAGTFSVTAAAGSLSTTFILTNGTATT